MISKIPTLLGCLVYAAYAFMAVVFVNTFLARANTPLEVLMKVLIVATAIMVPVFFGVRMYAMRRQIKLRSAALTALGSKMAVSYEPTRDVSLSSNFAALQPRDPHMFNIVAGPDWHYSDFTHAIYRRAKNGEYKAADVYYSMLELDLERALPTMLFDSPRTHHKQFKKYFDNSQVHHLEGDFDQHFTTYFPKYYSIDALSIITPEVMQAMIAADQFDIEIDSNKLYLYGPLVPVAQVPAMVAQGQDIRQKLMNNLVSYRDERLDFDAGRKGVSVYGTELRKNPFKGWPVMLVGVFLIISFIADPRHDPQVLIYGLAFMAPTAWSIWSAWHKNKQLDAQYAQHMQFLTQEKQGERRLGS